MTGDQLSAGHGPVLTAARPSAAQKTSAVLVISVYVLAILTLLPWASVSGPPVPQVVSMFTSGLVVGELATAFLLLAESAHGPSPSLLVLGCAYLYAAAMGVLHILTFPGAIYGDHPVFGAPRLTGYVFNAWRLGFITLVLGSILAPTLWRGSNPNWTIKIRSAIAVVILSIAIILGLGLALTDRSPLVSDRFSLWITAPSWVGVALAVLALFALCAKRRFQDSLGLWLCLVLVTFCGDLLVSTAGGGRYTVGWFAGRTSGFVSGITLFILYLSRLGRQEDIIKAELSRTTSLFQSVINMTPDLVFVKDLESRALLRNPAALFGRSWEEVKDRPEAEWHVSEEEAATVVQNDRLVIGSGKSMQFVEHFTTSQGKRVLLSTKSPLRDESGAIVGIIGVSTDITERERRAQHVEFVMRELSHRSKNLLMILQSIARQSIRQSSNFEQFEARFMARINSLALLHDLLLEEEWRGASLRALAEIQVQPFAGDRLHLEGPEFFLGPQIAQTFSMALHELATNASKYGALSGRTGTVTISWGYQPSAAGSIFVKWEELGGPPVVAPARKGFGSVVLERIVLQIPDAVATLEFAQDGVRWCLFAPAASVLDKNGSSARTWSDFVEPDSLRHRGNPGPDLGQTAGSLPPGGLNQSQAATP